MTKKRLVLACAGLTLFSLGCTLFFVFWRPDHNCRCVSIETRTTSGNPAKICDCGQGIDFSGVCQNICPWNVTHVANSCIELDYNATLSQCGSLSPLFHMYPDHSINDRDLRIGILFLCVFGIVGWIAFCCYIGYKYFEYPRQMELQDDEVFL